MRVLFFFASLGIFAGLVDIFGAAGGAATGAAFPSAAGAASWFFFSFAIVRTIALL
jgi:hypothetical protein